MDTSCPRSGSDGDPDNAATFGPVVLADAEDELPPVDGPAWLVGSVSPSVSFAYCLYVLGMVERAADVLWC